MACTKSALREEENMNIKTVAVLSIVIMLGTSGFVVDRIE